MIAVGHNSLRVFFFFPSAVDGGGRRASQHAHSNNQKAQEKGASEGSEGLGGKLAGGRLHFM